MTHLHLPAAAIVRNVVLTASLASALYAQDRPPVPTMPETLSTIRHGAMAPDGQPTGLWAAGPDFKVSFHDGMVFYPRVGADLPHQPMRWRTLSVRAGETELLEPGAKTPRPVHSDSRCDYDLGAVTERYDVLESGVEQSFVIEARPPAGDLIITGEVSSPLRLEPSAPRHGSLSFTLADGRPVIGYGAATAIDADGRRTPVTTATDGRQIVLCVSAGTVAAARFPLVVDPLVGNTLTALAGVTDDIDVLHETLTGSALQGRTWIVFSYAFAAGDHDLRLYRYGTGFTGSAQEVYSDITNWDARHGRLAVAPAASRVVLVHTLASGGNSWVVVHNHHTTAFGLSTSREIVPQGAVNLSDWRPDVGGRLQPSGNRVLITFQREVAVPFANTATSTVYATVFDASVVPQSAAFVVAPFVVLARPNADQERPVVNQASDSNNWMVAFQEINNAVSNDDWDITTVAVDGTGVAVPTGLETAHANDPNVHAITPEIAGAYGRYQLTYGVRTFELPDPRPLGARVRAVFGQRLDWTHATNTGSLPHAVVGLQSMTPNGLKVGGIGFDTISESHWCASVGNDVSDTYRVFKLGYTGNVVESATIALAATKTPEVVAVTFCTESRTFPIVYSEEDPAGASLHYGTEMAYQPAQPPTLLDFACGSGVWTGLGATANRQQIGSQSMPLRMTNAPANSFAFLVISLARADTPGGQFGAPGCTLVPDIFTGALLGTLMTAVTGGNAALSLDVPEYLPPMNLFMQWVYVASGANPLGMLATEGLRVQVAR